MAKKVYVSLKYAYVKRKGGVLALVSFEGSLLMKERNALESAALATRADAVAIEERGDGYRRIWVVPAEPAAPITTKPKKKVT
ncbi:MAG: hypothetical protein MMC33_002851 [Icmadophila ericetorum]|nr:hypothetical protein [Icmadophila ericetorum]